MSRDSGKRRIKWFAKPRAAAKGAEPGQAGGEAFPSLPQWPPLSGKDPSAPGQSAAAPAAIVDGKQAPPPWETGAPDKPPRARRSPRTLWQRFQTFPRRLRVGMLAGAGGVALLSLIAVVVFCAHSPFLASGSPSARQATATALASQSRAATASVSPAATTTAAAGFTITFTCASGVLKGAGKLCVHTQPNALLSLKVRYCDGAYAGGKGLNSSVRADSSGNYTWRWKVHTGCAGTATATVTAKSAGQTVTQSTTFTITH